MYSWDPYLPILQCHLKNPEAMKTFYATLLRRYEDPRKEGLTCELVANAYIARLIGIFGDDSNEYWFKNIPDLWGAKDEWKQHFWLPKDYRWIAQPTHVQLISE